MKFDNVFELPLQVDQAWALLFDVTAALRNALGFGSRN
jgi:hypothetical protein